MLNANMQTSLLNSQHWVKQNADKIKELVEKQQTFETDKADVLSELKEKSKRFEKERRAAEQDTAREIYDLGRKTKDEDYYAQVKEGIVKLMADITDDICDKCGAPKDSVKKMALTEDLHATKMMAQENNQNLKKLTILKKERDKALSAVNPYFDQIKRETAKENTFAAQVKAANEEKNPYQEQFTKFRHDHASAMKKIDVLSGEQDMLKVEISDLELLIDLTDVYRTSLVNSAILDLERKTNKYLSEHFDAEIKVKFESAGADRLEVGISKDGNSCSYTQLSKGQRGLLKLCFGLSVMKAVQNYSGVDFNVIFCDEVVEGSDDNLKVKAFGLLNELSVGYDSVFVIDHSEPLKAMFTNRYNVELVNGVSRIAEA